MNDADVDDLAALAAHLCDAPMALVSLVEDGLCRIAATYGLPATDPDRGSSFGAYAPHAPDVLVVPDTWLDPRFAAHPTVTGYPHLRFYAGAPLITSDGRVLGTLGVLDLVPRTLTERQRRQLRLVATQVVNQFEVRRQPGRLAAEQWMLNVVLEQTDVLIYAKDLDGRFVMTNPAVEHVTDGGLRGHTDHDLFPAAVADGYRRNDAWIVESRERHVFSEDLVHPDGTVHTYRSTKFPLFDDVGRVIGIAGVSTDVTELAEARAAHEEAEARWRTLVEHSPVAIVVIDAEGCIAYANPAAGTLVGALAAADLVGRSAVDLAPSGLEAETAAIIDGILAGGAPLRARQWPVRRIDGVEITVEFDASASTYRGASAVQVELRDVTAAAVAHAALTESERRLRAMFDDNPVAMALVDLDGRCVQVNAAFGDVIGIAPTEAVGLSAWDVIHPGDRHGLSSYDLDGPVGAGPGRVELRIVRPDGQLRWVWVSTRLTTGRAGEALILAVIQDVTARMTAERALQDSEADLASVAAIARCAQTGSDPRRVVVDATRELADAGMVFMLEAVDAETLVVTASAGVNVVGRKVLLADTAATARAWQTGQPVLLPDAAADPRANHPLLANDATVSVLAHPVIVDGRVEALLNVTWRHHVPDFAARAVRSVQIIATETGAALKTSRLREELERLAATDPLTGALNRRAWDAQLRTLAGGEGRRDTALVIAVVDLDYFKAYNDTHGHGAGDALLRGFAATTRATLRLSDVFARWGGEEFVVALPGTTLEQAAQVLERVRAGVPAAQTCSIGYTTWDGAESLDTAIARADAALYRAKNRGRNQLVRA